MLLKLTKKSVESQPAPSSGTSLVFDSELRGFGLKVTRAGRRIYFAEYGPRGRRRRMSLGEHGRLTAEEARAKAREVLAEVALGGDPLAERQRRRREHTWWAWSQVYLERAERRLGAASLAEYKRHLKRPACMKWNARPLAQITTTMVERAREQVAERGEVEANRWLATVSACFAEAVRARELAANPAVGIKPYRETPRQRVLSEPELRRVLRAITALQDPWVRLAFRLILETGARKSEVLNAQWEDLDLAAGVWRIPSPKAGRPQAIPLTAMAVAEIERVPRLGPFLVPGRNPKKRRADLKRPWQDVREAAKVPDVTIHDLRRTYGLRAARAAGLHVASKLLRHSSIRVTEQVYAPLGLQDDLLPAAEAASLAQVIQLRAGAKKRKRRRGAG